MSQSGPSSVAGLPDPGLVQSLRVMRRIGNQFSGNPLAPNAPEPQLAPVGRNWGPPTAGTSADFSATGRAVEVAVGNSSLWRLRFEVGAEQAGGAVGGEAQQLSPQIYQAVLEYPLGSPPRRFTANGQIEWVQRPGAAPLDTDLLGMYVPAGAPYAVRTFQRVSRAPQGTPTATLLAGGSLAVGTQLFFKVTTVDNGCESNGSTEVAVTPTSGNQTVALSWAPNSFQSAANIYVGTTSNANTYLMTVQGAAGVAIIPSLLGLTATACPTVQPTLSLRRLHYSSLELSSTQNAGGNGANQLLNTTWAVGAGTNVGPSTVFMPSPALVLSNSDKDVSLGFVGDSILNGAGNSPASGTGVVFSSQLANWGVVGATGRGLPWLNHSVGGSTFSTLLNNAGSAVNRMSKLLKPASLVCNMGTNDLALGTTWQQTAISAVTLAALRFNAGRRTFLATVLPRVVTTDGCITIGSQTPSVINAQRILYNTWLRNGCQFDVAGNPVQSGGAASQYVAGVFDAASYVEADATNALSLNGGFWQAPTTPVYTGTLTGTPTRTSLSIGASTPAIPVQGPNENAAQVHVIKITSGAAAGSLALIKQCTGGNSLTLYLPNDTTYTGTTVIIGFPVAPLPSSGDTFEIWRTLCAEGLHPANAGHAQVGAGFQSWLSSQGL